MLNSIINIDLHIHSKASGYKEEDGFVDNSSIDNLHVLFEKLQERNINLFSFTDHNRFDVLLYEKALEIIEEGRYPSVKGLLAGVEFDVLLEGGMKPCHIVTIFDAKTREDREKIDDAINNDILKIPKEAYSKIRYEDLLKEIGLNTILIVHQKQTLDRFDSSHRSLSGSTMDPYSIIEIGYINALEYHKNNVEGILKNNLQKIVRQVPLFTGSDCHQWEFYPKHDKDATYEIKQFTNMKSLPTFRGLLLALTSPSTRINKISKVKKEDYIDSFHLGERKVELDYGINAIIGENGSGKSTLMKLLNGDNTPAYVNRIKKDSNLVFSKLFNESKTLVVSQSEIVDKFNNDELFESSLYRDVDHSGFETVYQEHNKNLKNFIEHNIEVNTLFENLSTNKVIINPIYEVSTYYVQIDSSSLKLEDISVVSERKESLKKILEKVKEEVKRGFYDFSQTEKLTNAYNSIFEVYSEIIENYHNSQCRNSFKNILINRINEYQTEIRTLQTTADTFVTSYQSEKKKVINSVISYLEKINKKPTTPTMVRVIESSSDNQKNGFVFRRIAKYSELNVEEKYMKRIFVNDYQSLDKLFEIKTKEDMKSAITGCTSVNSIDEKWKYNFEKFLEEMKKSDEFILEAGSDVKEGRTLGQISLTYYKYHLNSENAAEIVCIDQPEDNLSNNHIQKELIKYLNALREHKQLIIVTHNPLLVVNLDVDNVIKVELRSGKLDIIDGCLEDDSNGILKYVAENMDGGKESIERRFKLYD